MELLVKVFTACITFIFSLGIGNEAANPVEFPSAPVAYVEEAPEAAASVISFEDTAANEVVIIEEAAETAPVIEAAEETVVEAIVEDEDTDVFTAEAEANEAPTADVQSVEAAAAPTFPEADYTEEEIKEITVSYEEEITVEATAAEEQPAAELVEDQVAAEADYAEQLVEEQNEIAAPVETKSAEELAVEETFWRGNYGRLFVNEVGVSTAVFYSDNLYNLQSIVDAEDSACMFDWSDGNTMIADHNYQGFDALKSCAPGSRAELVTASGTYSYTLLEIIPNGWNAGSSITYNDGTPISAFYTNSLVIYTCNYDGTITVTIWQ